MHPYTDLYDTKRLTTLGFYNNMHTGQSRAICPYNKISCNIKTVSPVTRDEPNSPGHSTSSITYIARTITVL